VAAPFGEGGDHFELDGKLADGGLVRMVGTAREGADYVVLPGGQIIPRPRNNSPR
jgi:hypothetical protein